MGFSTLSDQARQAMELLAICRDGNSYNLTPAALAAWIGLLSTALQRPPPSSGPVVWSGPDDVLTACGPIDAVAASGWQDGGASWWLIGLSDTCHTGPDPGGGSRIHSLEVVFRQFDRGISVPGQWALADRALQPPGRQQLCRR
ncbi:MAG: hypothetical protein ERJ67_07670 [Aphanocapsa feldmannii 277cV]|uniref:Uncharacterized protein n=1 Tax=Aphanocapsa feldmannii 277cV TaxID=2507553 RepID=A0A524RNE7_9CHRO|nr:MAG: hypothetical protein ERJ67_07670 [Aphanocapsa feldmannii 277cV]